MRLVHTRASLVEFMLFMGLKFNGGDLRFIAMKMYFFCMRCFLNLCIREKGFALMENYDGSIF